MERIYIEGGRKLSGKVNISGSKNASLLILAASLLAKGKSVIHNVPHIEDINTMLQVLRALGVEVDFSPSGIVTIDATNLNSYRAPYELVQKMRASFYVTGPLLARLKRAEVPLPGGCVIGTRPVDLHLKGFQSLGAEATIEHGYVKAEAKRLKGTRVRLEGRYGSSVGATVNTMTAACLAEGTTIIESAAMEPDVMDTANFLNKMGGKVKVVSPGAIEIEGVSELRGTSYTVMTDYIEAGTYMMAGGITGGDIVVEPASPAFLSPLSTKLKEANLQVEEGRNFIRVSSQGVLRSIEVTTSPYPGFHTDFQPQIVALLSIAKGTSIVNETVFDGRFMYVDELKRMGADIRVVGQTAIIEGVEKLTGAPVTAPDIRAGAALILAGLAAEGETRISGVEHIDRGYERIVEKLSQVGAKIRRCTE